MCTLGAKELPKEEFKREVDRYLTGKESEPWEIIYFKLHKGQLSTVERALEIAALMLGSDRSRGHSLEMICADFLAGATLEIGNLDSPASISRSIDEKTSTNHDATQRNAMGQHCGDPIGK